MPSWGCLAQPPVFANTPRSCPISRNDVLYPTYQYSLEFWGADKHFSKSWSSAFDSQCTFSIPPFSWAQLIQVLPMEIHFPVSVPSRAVLQSDESAPAISALTADMYSRSLDYDHPYQ